MSITGLIHCPIKIIVTFPSSSVIFSWECVSLLFVMLPPILNAIAYIADESSNTAGLGIKKDFSFNSKISWGKGKKNIINKMKLYTSMKNLIGNNVHTCSSLDIVCLYASISSEARD